VNAAATLGALLMIGFANWRSDTPRSFHCRPTVLDHRAGVRVVATRSSRQACRAPSWLTTIVLHRTDTGLAM
jgi:hypothetical protein